MDSVTYKKKNEKNYIKLSKPVKLDDYKKPKNIKKKVIEIINLDDDVILDDVIPDYDVILNNNVNIDDDVI